jgi:hypothetical protein
VSLEDHLGGEELLGCDSLEEGAATPEASEQICVRRWNAEQLTRLGVPRRAAPLFAELVDWHELDALLRRGCPLGIALEIAR